MSYLYKFTVSYQTRGRGGTPGPVVDYFFDLTVRRKLKRDEYRRYRRRFNQFARRRVNRFKGRSKGRLLIHERTSTERVRGSRAKKEKVKFQGVRYGKRYEKREVKVLKARYPKRTRKRGKQTKLKGRSKRTTH